MFIYASRLDHLHKTTYLSSTTASNDQGFVYVIVYALVNSIMCVPCLYGYASVVFSHEIYQSHINALSKLLILSSMTHQFCFSIFSTLPFAIGTVQDAGEFIFLQHIPDLSPTAHDLFSLNRSNFSLRDEP